MEYVFLLSTGKHRYVRVTGAKTEMRCGLDTRRSAFFIDLYIDSPR